MIQPCRRSLLPWTWLATCLVLALPVAALGDEPPVIEPDLARREVQVPRIDTEDFEIGIYGGVLSVEEFGSAPVYGVRVAYHITEDFFCEGNYARSTVSDTSFRRLGATVFPEEDQDLTYYDLSLGFNVLPGEVFIGRRVWTSAFYFIAGAGNTHFAGEDHLTYNVGFGLRALPTDWLSLRVETRDRIFESDILGEKGFTNNFELTAGIAVFF